MDAVTWVRLNNFRIYLRVWLENWAVLFGLVLALCITAMACVQVANSCSSCAKPGRHYDPSEDEVARMTADNVRALGQEAREQLSDEDLKALANKAGLASPLQTRKEFQ